MGLSSWQLGLLYSMATGLQEVFQAEEVEVADLLKTSLDSLIVSLLTHPVDENMSES